MDEQRAITQEAEQTTPAADTGPQEQQAEEKAAEDQSKEQVIINMWSEVKENRKEVFKNCQMTIRKNLWFLDGSKALNGAALLNAKEYKEEI